jgi:hypothetical protein
LTYNIWQSSLPQLDLETLPIMLRFGLKLNKDLNNNALSFLLTYFMNESRPIAFLSTTSGIYPLIYMERDHIVISSIIRTYDDLLGE